MNLFIAFGATPVSDGLLSNLSALKAGLYKLKALGTATTVTQGKATLASASFVSGISSFATGVDVAVTAGTVELASGVYTMNVTAADNVANTATISIVNSSGITVATTDLTTTDVGATIDLVDSSNADAPTGLSITTAGSGFTTTDSMTFEYVAAGNVKYELQDASGGKVTIDKDGAGSGTTTGTVGYYDASSVSNIRTGVGVSFNSAAFATTLKNQTLSFNYGEAGNYIVDVSTADRASTYMATVNNAIDTVNSSMTSLGSLMARLSFKEDQISTAQINVEASYSRIMNANMAEEQVNASKFTILQQTATAMLAQANTAPQSLLTLFR